MVGLSEVIVSVHCRYCFPDTLVINKLLLFLDTTLFSTKFKAIFLNSSVLVPDFLMVGDTVLFICKRSFKLFLVFSSEQFYYI